MARFGGLSLLLLQSQGLCHPVAVMVPSVALAIGLSSFNLQGRFPMRFPSGKIVATYSYTDDHVRFMSRFFLLLGCLMGGTVVGVLMHIFQ